MGFYDSDGVKVELRESVTIKKTVNPGTVIMFWIYQMDALSITLNGEEIFGKLLTAESQFYYYGITVDKAQKIEFSVVRW